jgi:hypothetical protein
MTASGFATGTGVSALPWVADLVDCRKGSTERTSSTGVAGCTSGLLGVVLESDLVPGDFTSSCRFANASGTIGAGRSLVASLVETTGAAFIASFFASASGIIGAGLSRMDGVAIRPVPSFIASFFCKMLSLNSSTRFVFCGPPVRLSPAFPRVTFAFSSSGAT